MQSVCLLLPCFHHTHVSSCALSCGYFLTKSEFLYFIKFCKLLSESSSTIILSPWVQVSTAVRATRILRGRYNLKANLVLNSQQLAFECVKFFRTLLKLPKVLFILKKFSLHSFFQVFRVAQQFWCNGCFSVLDWTCSFHAQVSQTWNIRGDVH